MIKIISHRNRDREFADADEYMEFERMVTFLSGYLPYPESWYYKIARNRVRAMYKKYKDESLLKIEKHKIMIMQLEEMESYDGSGELYRPLFKIVDNIKYVLTDSGKYEEYID